MRRSLLFLSIFLAGAVIAGLASRGAAAGPLPMVSDLKVSSGVVEKAQYARRYYRRQARRGYIVPPIDDTPVVVQDGLVLVPLRPRSCGQYRYWNGSACVDARYHDPYIGPKE